MPHVHKPYPLVVNGIYFLGVVSNQSIQLCMSFRLGFSHKKSLVLSFPIAETRFSFQWQCLYLRLLLRHIVFFCARKCKHITRQSKSRRRSKRRSLTKTRSQTRQSYSMWCDKVIQHVVDVKQVYSIQLSFGFDSVTNMLFLGATLLYSILAFFTLSCVH